MSDQHQETLSTDNPETQDSATEAATDAPIAEAAGAESPGAESPAAESTAAKSPAAVEPAEPPAESAVSDSAPSDSAVSDSAPLNVAEAQAADTQSEAEPPAAAVVEEKVGEKGEASSAPAAEAPVVEAAAEAAPVVEAAAEAAPVVEAAAEATPAVEAAAEATPAVEAAAEAAPAVEAAAKTAPAVEAGAPEGDPKLPLDISNQTPEMLALYDAMLQKRSTDGQVIGWNKGGYHVAIGRIAAFCPVSQIEIGNPRSPKRYLDKKFKFQIIEIQKGGRRVVLSRADALKAEREAIAAEVRTHLKPGMVREGKISSITDFGAFVDLGGGIEGLVHVSEISRKRVEHPKEILQSGQEVRVTVLKIEKGGQRISLSMKRLEEDPWAGLKERFTPGDTFSGTVLRQTDFGFFVEIEAGLEGLVHNSRLPLGVEATPLEIGATVEGWVHEVDAKRRRLSLSLRPVAQGNPWQGIEERMPEGTIIQGKVERLAHFGAFIELEPGLTGLLPFSALGMAPANPRKQFHPGKEVSVRVLAIDRDKRRISLGTEASQAEGSHNDFREYKKKQSNTSKGGLSVMEAAFAKLKQREQADA